MSDWTFYPHKPGYKLREAMQGEFFSTDVIRNEAEALVREGIQNSLDARVNSEKVSVRIYISGLEGALSAAQTERYYNGCWTHFNANANGLRDAPGESDPCRFIVFEDFGTTGLTGDVAQWQDFPGQKNSFFYFFRAEGLSDKGDASRGRWGVGKFVFPRSSRLKTFFALTVRSDDNKEMLMGQTVLKAHHAAENFYTGDADYGIPADHGLVVPSLDNDLLTAFKNDFKLKRTGESGLSLVIPWCKEEINSDLLLEAVIRQYFFPIMAGELVVTVSTPSTDTEVNKDNIYDIVNLMSESFKKELMPAIKIISWALQENPDKIPCIEESPADSAPRWVSDLLPEDFRKNILEKIESGEKVSMRVPVQITEKGIDPQKTFFDIFLIRDGNNSGFPIFIREDIIISDIRRSRARGYRSIVIVNDKPLATFLGDSENPAHTQWQKDGSNFKGKYEYGPSTLSFIIKSVAEITRLLNEQAEEEDPSLLIDAFSLPSDSSEDPISGGIEKKPKPGKKSGHGGGAIPKKKMIQISQISGGFTVSNRSDFSPPKKIKILTAYDIRKGNPFKKYSTSDFEIAKDPIHVEIEPADTQITMNQNTLEASIKSPDFKITIKGFDEKRDLKVNVNVKEVTNDTEN